MENRNQIQPLEAGESILLSAPPCNGAVCIPLGRYDELLRAESDLSVLRRSYQTMNGFTMDYVLDAIFNPKFKYKSQDLTKARHAPKESAADAE